jgi:hypothetical protein
MDYDDAPAEDALARYTVDERDLEWSVVGHDPVDVPDVSRFFWSKRSFLKRVLVVVGAMFAMSVVSLGVAVANEWFFSATPEKAPAGESAR